MNKLLSILHNLYTTHYYNITIEQVLSLYNNNCSNIKIKKDLFTIDQETNKQLYLNSENIYLYFFNKIRLYYLDYLEVKQQFITNNNQLRIDSLEFIKLHKLQAKDIKPPINTTINIDKTNENYAKEEINKKKLNFIEKEVEKEEKEEENKKKSSKSDQSKPNKPKQSNKVPPKPKQTFYNKIKEYFNKLDLQYESKFFKKIYRKISVYTHPDKTNDKFLQQLFLLSKKSYQNKQYFMLVLISSILGITKYKLHNKEKSLLNSDIEKIINNRKQLMKNIVYSYHKLSKLQQKKVIVNCLKNGILQVNFKDTF